MKRFENKTVVVTGAGSGIGAACVRRLFDEGASVVAADVQKENVDRVVAEFEGSDRVYGVGVDISNREQVAALVSGAVQRFGQLWGLVNCAGIRGVGSVLTVEPEVWRKVLSVNLDGTFNVCQAFALAMKDAQASGAIVNLSSAAGIRGVPNRLPYAASKYGIVGISQTMALELGPIGIRVNAIAPGLTDTDMANLMEEKARQNMVGNTSLKRLARPEEVAGVAVFLASDMASFVTGHVLCADGGSS